MTQSNHWTRRNFLKCAMATAAGASSPRAALGLLAGLKATSATAAATDYRALVCIFLAGGNDGFNVLIPSDDTRYAIYKKVRANLALPKDALQSLTSMPGGLNYSVPSDAVGLKNMYNNGQLAFVANVGTLLQPTSKNDYLAGKSIPPQLFSHNDQSDQMMSSQPDALQKVGWGGRIADLLSNLNTTGVLPLGVSIGGNNLFQIGDISAPYYLNSEGADLFNVVSPGDNRTKLFKKILTLSGTNGGLLEQTFANSVSGTIKLSQSLNTALENSSIGTVIWPGSGLANQLKMVARMINIRQKLGMSRQVFYVVQGGYDTHDDQLNHHNGLISELSQAVEAFHDTMAEFGINDQVTSFTLSDFGRTLTSNGDGTDHSWGNVQMVAGGAVIGANVYGTFPNQTVDGPDDLGYGRLIPTTSVEQYGATLASWFGATNDELQTIFPHLDRFATPNLGFMSAS